MTQLLCCGSYNYVYSLLGRYSPCDCNYVSPQRAQNISIMCIIFRNHVQDPLITWVSVSCDADIFIFFLLPVRLDSVVIVWALPVAQNLRF